MSVMISLAVHLAGLIAGGYFLVSALGYAWRGQILASLVAGAIMAALIGFISTYLNRTLTIFPSILASLPTLLFALGSMGDVRDKPMAFLFWSGLGTLMLLSGYVGALAAKRALPVSKVKKRL